MEFKTIKYNNNARGVSQKNQEALRLAEAGWKIESESIEPGKFKGEKACCLATICLPLGAAAGSTDGFIVVTYSKEERGDKFEEYQVSSFGYKKCPTCAEEIKVEARKCRYCQEEFSPEEIERAVEESNKRYEAEKAKKCAAEELAKKRQGKQKCPQCGKWDIHKATLKDGSMGDYCQHCKKAFKDM